MFDIIELAGIKFLAQPTQANHGETISICTPGGDEIARMRSATPEAKRLADLLCAAPQLAARLKWALVALGNMELSDTQLDSLRAAQKVLDGVMK